MQPRFNARALIAGDFFDDNGNRYQKDALIYNVAVYPDGAIGIDRDSFIDQLDALGFTAQEIEDVLENDYSTDDEWVVMGAHSIDQCVGIKDKNNRWVYENDIIQFQNQNMTEPEIWGFFQWDYQRCAWCITGVEHINRPNFCGGLYADMADEGIHEPTNIAVISNVYIWGEQNNG